MKQSVRTQVVAITGPDGSGKSTACFKVSELLNARFGAGSARVASAWDAVAASGLFPTREAVTSYFTGLEPQARCLFILHAMSQSIALAKKADPRFLIIDGHFYKYAASELAYGTPEAVALGACHGFEAPDRVFFLGIDPATAWKRKSAASSYESGGASGHEAFLEFQRRMSHSWEVLEARFGPWYHLSPFNRPDETARQICEHILSEAKDDCRAQAPSLTPSY
jgi:thymidylate kinase